jgi:hypothetical protein
MTFTRALHESSGSAWHSSFQINALNQTIRAKPISWPHPLPQIEKVSNTDDSVRAFKPDNSALEA